MLAACTGGVNLLSSSSGETPITWIDKPLPDSQYVLEPIELLVHANATQGVAAIAFSVNGQLVEALPINGGARSFVTLPHLWIPSATGEYTLSFTAQDAAGTWGAGSDVTIQVVSRLADPLEGVNFTVDDAPPPDAVITTIPATITSLPQTRPFTPTSVPPSTAIPPTTTPLHPTPTFTSTSVPPTSTFTPVPPPPTTPPPPPDTERPVILELEWSPISPQEDSTVSFNVVARDNVGVSRIEIYFVRQGSANGGPIHTCNNTDVCTYDATSGFPWGTYSYYAIAYDVAGNQVSTFTQTVVVQQVVKIIMMARTLAAFVAGPFLLAVLLTACGNQPATQHAGPLITQRIPTVTLDIEPQDGGEDGTAELLPVEVGYKDLTVRPQIWFGPLDPWSWDRYYPGQGPFEFYDLFQPDAPWQQASDAVHVIRLYPVWIDSYATPQQLQTVLQDIEARGIAISYEAGPLKESGQCNASTIEGFWGKPGAKNIAQNIKDAGGRLFSMDLEHGFDAATYYDLACRKSPREIAEDAAITINALRAIFPDVLIGSIETADLNVDDVAAWMEAYRGVMGEELDYFHLDINFQRVDWAERAREIEDYVESRGVEFGIIYFGNQDDGSDIDWINHAESRFIEYEVLARGNTRSCHFSILAYSPAKPDPRD